MARTKIYQTFLALKYDITLFPRDLRVVPDGFCIGDYFKFERQIA